MLYQPVICIVVFLVHADRPHRNANLCPPFHFVCSSCFLPLKPNPSAIASVCFGSCVQEKPSAFHATFLCRNSTDVRKPGPMRSQIFTFEHFTHQLFEIFRPVIWNAENEIVSPVHTKRFQHCAPVETRHHRISLEAMIVETFLHRRKHLTCVTSAVETLEQFPDLPLLAKVLRWYHVDHLAHFPMEERHRNVKHSDDQRRVCSLGLLTSCPTQNQSHEFQRRGCRKRVRSRFTLVDFRGTQPSSYCWAVWTLSRFPTILTRFSCPVSLASLIRLPPF